MAMAGIVGLLPTEQKLLLTAYIVVHVYRLVPKCVTLNDLQGRFKVINESNAANSTCGVDGFLAERHT